MKEIQCSMDDYTRMSQLGGETDVFSAAEKLIDSDEAFEYVFRINKPEYQVVMVHQPDDKSISVGLFTDEHPEALFTSAWSYGASPDNENLKALKMTHPVVPGTPEGEEPVYCDDAVCQAMSMSISVLVFFIATLEPRTDLKEGLSIKIDLSGSHFTKPDGGLVAAEGNKLLH